MVSRDERARSHNAGLKSLHWIIAAFVIAQIALGLTMTRITGSIDVIFQLYQLHKSFGFLILALMAFRVPWSLMFGAPPLPEVWPKWERASAQLTHLCLYGILLCLPLTGWLLISASDLPIPTRLFGIVQVPHLDFIARLPRGDRSTFEQFLKTTHSVLAYALVGLLVLHVTAALRHHLILKDHILRSMLFTRKPTN
jgi:cytochrome b561